MAAMNFNHMMFSDSMNDVFDAVAMSYYVS